MHTRSWLEGKESVGVSNCETPTCLGGMYGSLVI